MCPFSWGDRTVKRRRHTLLTAGVPAIFRAHDSKGEKERGKGTSRRLETSSKGAHGTTSGGIARFGALNDPKVQKHGVLSPGELHLKS